MYTPYVLRKQPQAHQALDCHEYLQPAFGGGYKYGKSTALSVFPLTKISPDLCLPHHRLSPPLLHFGFPVTREDLLRFAVDHDLAVLHPITNVNIGSCGRRDRFFFNRRPEDDFQNVLEFIDDLETIPQVLKYFQETTGVADLHWVQVELPSGTISLLALNTNTALITKGEHNKNGVLKLMIALSLKVIPKWYPDYMWGMWRKQVNARYS